MEIEIDEMWSFVTSKEVKTWVWLALERTSRQIVGFATGDRSSYCGQVLWSSLPTYYQETAIFYTDAWAVYDELIPAERHRQEAGGTAHIERFNNTLRQ
ncbi:IS1 family transposase, partial [Spirosoma areae]